MLSRLCHHFLHGFLCCSLPFWRLLVVVLRGILSKPWTSTQDTMTQTTREGHELPVPTKRYLANGYSLACVDFCFSISTFTWLRAPGEIFLNCLSMAPNCRLHRSCSVVRLQRDLPRGRKRAARPCYSARDSIQTQGINMTIDRACKAAALAFFTSVALSSGPACADVQV